MNSLYGRGCGCALALFALWMGGGKPQENARTTAPPNAASVAAHEKWQERRAERAAKMRQGLTEQEVGQSLGKATCHHTVVGAGESIAVWSLRLSGNAHFAVRFDRKDRILSWGLTSSTRVQ